MLKNVRIETPHATFNIGSLQGGYHEGDKYVPADAGSKTQAWRDAKAAQKEARQPGKLNGDLVGGRTIINGKERSSAPAETPQREPQPLPPPAYTPAKHSADEAVPSVTTPESGTWDLVQQGVGETAVGATVRLQRNSALAEQITNSVMARFGPDARMHGGASP